MPPVVCTLTTKARARQELEWSNLGDVAIDVRRVRGGAEVHLPAHRYEAVAELVGRELACCGSWLNLALRRQERRLILTATTDNPDGLALIWSMVGLE